MMTIRGFDSRYWDGGAIPPIHQFRFYYAKATDGGNFTSPDFARQWHAAKSQGLETGAFHFHRGRSAPSPQARIFQDAMTGVGGPRHLPLVLDLEDTSSGYSLAMADNMLQTMDAIEQWYGKAVMIYTGKWCWDRILPYLQPRHDAFYDRLLWEADPPPDTPTPGKWQPDHVKIVQVKLDIVVPGFNAEIDEDLADEDWFNGLAGTQPQPTVDITIPLQMAEELRAILARALPGA